MKKSLVITLIILIGISAYLVINHPRDESPGCIKYVGGVVGVRNECKSTAECEVYKKINNGAEVGQCYWGVATNSKDKNVCDLIPEEWLKQACLNTFSN
jgi:hypothetical protein